MAKPKNKMLDIKKIIYDLKDTVQTLNEYLKKQNLLEYKKEIEKAIYDQQEIGQCVNCDSWEELGEFNEEGECAGCNSMED